MNVDKKWKVKKHLDPIWTKLRLMVSTGEINFPKLIFSKSGVLCYSVMWTLWKYAME